MQFRKVYTEKEATAYHESGHALVAYLRKVRIIKVSIKEDERIGQYGNLVYSGKLGDILNQESPEIALQRIRSILLICMGGLTAEYLFTGKRNIEGASSDLQVIQSLENLYTNQSQASKEVTDLWVECEKILRDPSHWKMVKGLAEYLLDARETIDGKKAWEILKKANPEYSNINGEDFVIL